nr:MAG TPA: tail tape measure protein [Caudoviricetes sp.]
MFDPIINWGMSINGHLGDVFIDIYGIFEDWFKLIKDIVKDNLRIIGDLFSGDWQKAAEDVGLFFQHLGDNIGNIFNGIRLTVQDAFLAIGSAISQTAQKIWGNVTNWFSTKTAQLGNFFTGMFNQIVKFLESIPDRVLYMLSFLAGVVARGLYEVWNFVTVTIPQWIAQLGVWLSELPGKFSNWLQQTYNRVTDWASKMWAKAQETGQQFVAKCIQFIQTLPGRIWTWLVNTYNKVTTWASQMWEKAKHAGVEFVKRVETSIRTLPSRVWSWLQNTVQKAIAFAQQFAAKGQKAAIEFKDKIINGIKSLPGKVGNIGKQIVRGLWNGISGMGSWLKGKISGWANTIVQGFKAGFNIHSPSKRMAEEVGKFLPTGLVVGVKMTTGQALKDIRKFSDQVMQAAQLGDFANSYQIDTGNLSTTNITNQAGTIAAINDLKRVVQQQNNNIDYNKLKDCFVEGAKNVDGTIVMDNTVVGKKVAEPVRSTNKLVLERLNRLEGI